MRHGGRRVGTRNAVSIGKSCSDHLLLQLGEIEGWSFVIAAAEEKETHKKKSCRSGRRPKKSAVGATWASIVNLMSLATRRCPVNDSMRGLTAAGLAVACRRAKTPFHPIRRVWRKKKEEEGRRRKSHASSFISHHFQLCNHANWQRAGPCLLTAQLRGPPPSLSLSLYYPVSGGGSSSTENPSQSKMMKTIIASPSQLIDREDRERSATCWLSSSPLSIYIYI